MNEWPAGGCSMMVEAGGFHILLPLHQSCFPLSHLLMHLFQTKPTPPSFTRRDRQPGTSPLTDGRKMEGKKETASIMDQYQQHRHPPNCHCTCPLPAISKTHFLFPPRSMFSSLDRGGLSISAYEKIAFRFLSFPLFHLSLYPFLSPRPAMHSSPTSHSAVSSSVDASLHFPRTPLPTPSSLYLSNSAICPPSVLWHLPCSNSLSVSCCCRCHSPLPPRPAPRQEALHSQLEMRTMQLSVIHSL